MNLGKFSLADKCALITGGAGLLGLEHAFALLESGAQVILGDLDFPALSVGKLKLEKYFDSEKVLIKVLDVTNPSSIKALSSELELAGVRVDILINNAAIDSKVNKDGICDASRLEHFSLIEWEKQIAVGLTGAFLCSQVFGSKMALDNKGGVILNIASDLSVFSPDQRLYRKNGVADNLQPVKPVTYSVIKTGLIGLTRYLATYWADRGVRCNAMSPGGVFVDQDDEFVRRISSLIPMGRMASKDEYRSAVQFLCSQASSYLNGQNIIMDGGRSVW